MAATCFWTAFACIVYVYLGYPLLLMLWRRVRRRSCLDHLWVSGISTQSGDFGTNNTPRPWTVTDSLLIGARLTHENLGHGWLPVLIAIGAVMLGRALSVYGCSVLWQWSAWRVHARDQHILFWGGLRGALALALALGLPAHVAGRDTIVMVAFGVVTFSVVVQGLMIAPLLRQAASDEPALRGQ